MPKFDYTAAAWDKIRPLTLAKTGLGAALRQYEKARMPVEKGAPGFVQAFPTANDVFAEVEKARAAAIKACGKNILYKSCKTALDGADPAKEQTELADAFRKHLSTILSTVEDDADAYIKKQDALLKRVETINALFKAKKAIPKQEWPLISLARNTGGLQPDQSGTFELTEVIYISKNKSKFGKLVADVVSDCSKIDKKMVIIQKNTSDQDDAVVELIKYSDAYYKELEKA